MDIGQLIDGLIPFSIGTYMLLLANGFLPQNPKHQLKTEHWRQKYGGMIKVISPFLIIWGTFQMGRAFF